MRKFKPGKPKKVSSQIKEKIAQVLRDNLLQRLPQLSSRKEAEDLESNLYILWSEGIISDFEYYQYSQKIKEICKENNWAMP